MKTLHGGLQSHLDTGTTSMCYCWKLTRADGTVFGFTDHDRDLAFDGVTYEAVSGFTATAIETRLGLAVDNLDVMGALRSDAITETDLSNGLFDNAAIEIWWVNWSDVAQRVIMRVGNIGEVSRGKTAFSAEVRGLAHKLDQQVGRIYQAHCDADLGDSRCKIDLNGSAYKGSGVVSSAAGGRVFKATGLAAYSASWFARGKVTWATGDNQGVSMEIKTHGLESGIASFELWQPMGKAIAIGDTFEVHAGCAKDFATCLAKFANGINFRGFPHIPGNDILIDHPRKGDQYDGGSRYGN